VIGYQRACATNSGKLWGSAREEKKREKKKNQKFEKAVEKISTCPLSRRTPPEIFSPSCTYQLSKATSLLFVCVCFLKVFFLSPFSFYPFDRFLFSSCLTRSTRVPLALTWVSCLLLFLLCGWDENLQNPTPQGKRDTIC
jgi:hypothetical protein